MKIGCGEIPATGDSSSAAGGAMVAESNGRQKQKQKPPFRPAKDDTKPILRDPILRSDPIESEQAVLRLPPFPAPKPTSNPSLL